MMLNTKDPGKRPKYHTESHNFQPPFGPNSCLTSALRLCMDTCGSILCGSKSNRLENKPWALQVGSPMFPWIMARFKSSIQPTTCPSAVVELLQYHNLNQTHPWRWAQFMTVSTTLALPPGHNSRTRCVEVIGLFHTTWKDKSKQFSLEKNVGQDFRQSALHQTNWHPKVGIQKL